MQKGDVIYRQQAIDALGEEPEVWEDDDEYGMGQRSEWCYIKKTIEKLPSAQTRKKGKWIILPPIFEEICQCSNCKMKFKDALQWTNYCQNCGADMRGESDE